MMYRKATLFSSPQALVSEILSTASPKTVRTLGRKVPNFSDKLWHAHREEIVRQGNVLKFTRPVEETADEGWLIPIPHVSGDEEGEVGEKAEGKGEGEAVKTKSLRELLLETGDRELVEASPMDRIWGIGFGAAKAGTVGRERWGLNLLGKALMEVRAMLRREAEWEGDGEGKEVVKEKEAEVQG